MGRILLLGARVEGQRRFFLHDTLVVNISGFLVKQIIEFDLEEKQKPPLVAHIAHSHLFCGSKVSNNPRYQSRNAYFPVDRVQKSSKNDLLSTLLLRGVARLLITLRRTESKELSQYCLHQWMMQSQE